MTTPHITLRPIDRTTGEAGAPFPIIAAIPMLVVFDLWEALGWDLEIVEYHPA